MHLSTVPLPGARLVRASRLLRVLHPHEVLATGAATLDLSKVETVPGAAPIPTTAAQAGKVRVRAVEGDLALEVVEVKTGAPIGYSYLSGSAIQCMGYDLAPHRFEPGGFQRLTELEQVIASGCTLHDYDHDPDQAEAILMEMVERLQAAKASGQDLVALEVPAAGKNYQQLAQTILEMWSAVKKGTTSDPDRRTHLFALVWKKKRLPSFLRPKGSSDLCTFHAQPPRHASDHAATPFQHQLVLTLPAPA